ncbi:hypothetical protein SAY87_008736 [Trapa incisa]|uniref:Uncharacterized protein n=1 Tax=Trapa incisa TaxID=236973 RepID=A0AAN7JYC0_9MYRT|nr:hypothetical protein SAY87_008736 [Trapa incisa]
MTQVKELLLMNCSRVSISPKRLPQFQSHSIVFLKQRSVWMTILLQEGLKNMKIWIRIQIFRSMDSSSLPQPTAISPYTSHDHQSLQFKLVIVLRAVHFFLIEGGIQAEKQGRERRVAEKSTSTTRVA